eukprot:SAG11_NODE_32476_length_283_cov_0.842391_1_plen_42_part_01
MSNGVENCSRSATSRMMAALSSRFHVKAMIGRPAVIQGDTQL